MREVALILMASALVGASTPASPPRTAQAQAKLDKMLAGRVAGEPVSCLKSDRTYSPIGIDDQTMLFRDGPRIWRNDLRGALNCSNLGGRKSLVTEGSGIRVCSGDTVHIVDMTDGSPVGGCVLGEFVPYTKP